MSIGRQRFSIIPAEAVTDPALEGRDLQVLALLGRHTDNRGWCCRSQVKMAREINCGRATIQRSIGRLVDAGYLEHRAIVRDNGGDAAHEYRVVLDLPDDRADRVRNSDTEGVPTSEQGGAHQRAGVPTQDGQGVPTHERAPMLTTPVKRNRESARDEEEDFERARRAWPSGFADSREDALAAWRDLSPDDRRAAAFEIDRFVAATRSVGRKLICGFPAYLREHKWEALPPRPAPRPVASSAAPAPPRKPTAFMLAHPELYPELALGKGDTVSPMDQGEEAA